MEGWNTGVGAYSVGGHICGAVDLVGVSGEGSSGSFAGVGAGLSAAGFWATT